MEISYRKGVVSKVTIHDVTRFLVSDCREGDSSQPFVAVTATDEDGTRVCAMFPPEVIARLADELSALFAPTPAEAALDGDQLKEAANAPF